MKNPKSKIHVANCLLDLGGLPGITDTWLATHAKQFGTVQCLSLSGSAITDAGLTSLNGLLALQRLNLSMTGITDLSLLSVQSLTELNLWRSTITHRGLANLACLYLEQINLGHTDITDAGLPILNQLRRLRALYLHETKVTNIGSLNLQALQQLWLSSTRFTDAGLANLDGLPALRELYLSGTEVTPLGLANLKSRYPKVECFTES